MKSRDAQIRAAPAAAAAAHVPFDEKQNKTRSRSGHVGTGHHVPSDRTKKKPKKKRKEKEKPETTTNDSNKFSSPTTTFKKKKKVQIPKKTRKIEIKRNPTNEEVQSLQWQEWWRRRVSIRVKNGRLVLKGKAPRPPQKLKLSSRVCLGHENTKAGSYGAKNFRPIRCSLNGFSYFGLGLRLAL